MPKKILEEVAVDCLIPPQDVGTTDVVTPTYVDVSLSGRFVILAKAGAVTAAKVLTAQPFQATSAAGAGAKVLGAAFTSVGVGGAAPPDLEIEIASADMDVAGGFKFAGVTLGIDESAKLGCAYLLRGHRRYTP